MKRKIYEINVAYNQPMIFYTLNGELVNTCDSDRPEPISMHGAWSPQEQFTRGTNFVDRLLIPVTRMKKEHVNAFLKIQIPEMAMWADASNMNGNMLIFKKEVGDEVLVGMAVRDEVAGKLIE